MLGRPDFVEAAPTFPGNSRLRLPPASPHRYDGRTRAVFHLHPNNSASRRTFCLITDLVDHEFATAVELAAAYAQRWEIELSFDEIEIHPNRG